MTDPRELEDRLRAELNRHAERTPGGTLLAEQIIAAAHAHSAPDRRRRGWPTWTLPLLAAGAVAAIVAGVFVGVAQIRDDAGPAGPPVSPYQPTVSHRPAHRTPSVHSSPITRPSASRTASVPDNPVGLTNFVVRDITFVGTSDGWAIGSADCLDGSGGTCPAMVRTSDGGAHWKSMPNPPGDVTGIRFATDQIGYAFSDSVLEMTTDGGTSWTPQAGGAIALETFNQNVVRLIASSPSGCPGPCNVRAEYAPIGATNWAMSDLGPLVTSGVQLVRSDADVYVLAVGNAAKGTPAGTLYASTDNGATWTGRGAPCPNSGSGHRVAVAVAAAPGGAVIAGCSPVGGGAASFRVSRDAGASFGPTAGTVAQQALQSLAGDPSTVLVAAGIGAYRSTDGGASWSPIGDVSGTATFVGFESPTLGRIVTDDGRTIWTTTDAGVHWTPFTFPS